MSCTFANYHLALYAYYFQQKTVTFNLYILSKRAYRNIWLENNYSKVGNIIPVIIQLSAENYLYQLYLQYLIDVNNYSILNKRSTKACISVYNFLKY